MNKIIYIFLAVIGLSSCSIIKKPLTIAPKNAKEIITRVNSENPQANWIHLKGRLKIIKNSGFENSFNINIKNKKDSIIWISVRAVFGIEIIRAQITPDSAYVINRLDKTYLTTTTSKIKEFIALDLSFYDFQDMIIAPPKILKKNYKLEADGTNFYLTSDNFNYCITNKYKIKNIKVLKNNTVLEFIFDDYKESDNFPRKLVMKIITEEILEATINYSKVELNKPQEIVFSTPPFYDKIK